MAASNITVRIDPTEALATLRELARTLWELQWYRLTGVPWEKSSGKATLASLEVTIGDRPWESHVRIDGTVLELPCSNVTVTQDARDIGRVSFEVPMSHVTLRTAS